MYARYRTRSRFYKRPEKLLRAYGVSPNLLRRPQVKPGLLRGIYRDETIDLRDKERLELLESLRHPKERDFYQDHTYHNQWVMRDLEKHHKSQLASRYKFFSPHYMSSSPGRSLFDAESGPHEDPWLFYPGDTVEVIKGEGKGQRGAIIAVVKYKNEVLVQNVNVQDVVIPASETRPEQTVQREHPIQADRVRHVDPSTNELCELTIVTVKNKSTGALEVKRMSLTSGVLLPLPDRDEGAVEVGDPLKDTPIADADEVTYDPAKEISLLTEKKCQEMEQYFVNHSLKNSYAFHSALSTKNAEQMQAFQIAVVERAAEKLAMQVAQRVGSPPEAVTVAPEQAADDSHSHSRSRERAGQWPSESGLSNFMRPWWNEMIAAHVEVLKEEDAILAAEAAELARQEQAELSADNRMTGGFGSNNDDDGFLDEEGEEASGTEDGVPSRGVGRGEEEEEEEENGPTKGTE